MGQAGIPTAHNKSSTIGGRDNVKYVTIAEVFSASGPTSLDEGTQGTYNFFTNQPDGTYYYSLTPTTRTVEDNGSFTVSSGTGSFTLSATENEIADDTTGIAVAFRQTSVSGPLVDVISTSIADDTTVLTYTLTGALTVDEGATTVFTITSNDITLAPYYNVTTSGRFTVASNSVSMTDVGADFTRGDFTLSAGPNETSGDTGNAVIQLLDQSFAVKDTHTISVVDTTVTDTYSASGPPTLSEGSTGTYNFFTNVADGTYNYTVTPTGRFTSDSGTFSVASELGTFDLTAATNATTGDTADIDIQFKTVDSTLRDTVTTTVTNSTAGAAPSAGDTDIYSLGATWKYEDSGTDLGTAWKGTSYDDSGWSSGAGELGFGDGDESTVIGDVNQVTAYFRKTVDISNATGYDSILIDVLYDDAFILHVNDAEVGRIRLNSGAAFSATASSSSGDNNRYTATLPTSAFVDGSNVIAVEIHQSSATSSDLSFDMGLSGRVDVAGGPVTVTYQEGDADSYAGTTDTYVQSGANEGTDRGANTTTIHDKNASNERFGLTKFDDIESAFVTPADVRVTAASVRFTISSEGQGVGLHTFNMAFAESDTWTSRNTSGLFTGGTGYTLSSIGDWAGADGFTGNISIALDNATVESWIKTPASNHGFFIIGTHASDGQQFRSSEHTTQAQRPLLSITMSGSDLA